MSCVVLRTEEQAAADWAAEYNARLTRNGVSARHHMPASLRSFRGFQFNNPRPLCPVIADYIIGAFRSSAGRWFTNKLSTLPNAEPSASRFIDRNVCWDGVAS